MQDEIVARLAGALNAQLVAAEARRAAQAPNPNSTDFYFQGLAWINKGLTLDHVARARSFYDRALTADPDNVDALIASAAADVADGANSYVTDAMAALAAAEGKLTKALSSVPDHARAHMWLGFVDIMTRRAAQGIARCEHALALDRNLATAHSAIGFGKIFIGRAEEAEAHIGDAQRLSPRDTGAYVWMNMAGLANLHLGDYELAVAWCRRSVETNRNYPAANFDLAAALVLLGRFDEARAAVKAGLALNPIYTVSRVRAYVAALLARFSELKRKASERTGKSFPIVVIQEAGLDGFWLHRVLQSEGVESHVVDPSSIATSRRRRRAKTDRIDGEALLRALLAYKRGEPRVCAMVKAPTPEEEDRRRRRRWPSLQLNGRRISAPITIQKAARGVDGKFLRVRQTDWFCRLRAFCLASRGRLTTHILLGSP